MSIFSSESSDSSQSKPSPVTSQSWVCVVSESSECLFKRRLSSFGAHVRRHRHFSLVSSWPSFLNFTRRFWNHILTCFSDKFKYVAISIRRSLERYILELNSRSSSSSWVLVNAVRILLLLRSSVELLTPETQKSGNYTKIIFLPVVTNIARK